MRLAPGDPAGLGLVAGNGSNRSEKELFSGKAPGANHGPDRMTTALSPELGENAPGSDVSHLTPQHSHSLFNALNCRPDAQSIRAISPHILRFLPSLRSWASDDRSHGRAYQICGLAGGRRWPELAIGPRSHVAEPIADSRLCPEEPRLVRVILELLPQVGHVHSQVLRLLFSLRSP